MHTGLVVISSLQSCTAGTVSEPLGQIRKDLCIVAVLMSEWLAAVNNSQLFRAASFRSHHRPIARRHEIDRSISFRRLLVHEIHRWLSSLAALHAGPRHHSVPQETRQKIV